MITIEMRCKMRKIDMMPKHREIFPEGINSHWLVEYGLRTAVTRTPFAGVGETFKIANCAGLFRVKRIETADFNTSKGRLRWMFKEAWVVNRAEELFPDQVYHGAPQTVFERIK